MLPADENVAIALVLLDCGGHTLSIVPVNVMVELHLGLQGLGKRFDRQVRTSLTAICSLSMIPLSMDGDHWLPTLFWMLRDDVSDVVSGGPSKDLHEGLGSLNTERGEAILVVAIGQLGWLFSVSDEIEDA